MNGAPIGCTKVGTSQSMSRALITFLLRCWLVALYPPLVLVFLLVLHLLWGQDVTLPFILVIVQVLFPPCIGWLVHGKWRPNLWLWRLSRRVMGFRTVSGGRVALLFPDGLDGAIDLHEVMRWSESDLDDLAQRFEFALRRRLTVVLVSGHRDLAADFGQPMGGTMLAHANAVVLAADYQPRETLRHELVHLFAARWNRDVPPLFEEGLAFWLQRTERGVPIEEVAGRLLRQSDTNLASLLNLRYFFSAANQYRCHILASGFTGFLVRRFGWDAYRDVYRKAGRWPFFRARFKRRFGMSLEGAWQRWRDESMGIVTLGPRLRWTGSSTECGANRSARNSRRPPPDGRESRTR